MEFASLYRHVIHKRAVATVQIRDDVFVSVLFDKGVAARDGGISNPEIRAGLAADQHRSLAHRDDRVFQLASNSGEPWFHTLLSSGPAVYLCDRDEATAFASNTERLTSLRNQLWSMVYPNG